MNYIEKREKRVRIALIRDLIRMNMLTCRPISQRRDTRELAAQSTRKVSIVQHETVTMDTSSFPYDKKNDIMCS